MKVYYPQGGTHFLLHWWSYNDRGHIILARSEKSILPVFQKVLLEHPDLELRDYLEIDIVSPPKFFFKMAEALDLKEKVDNFYYEIIYRLKDLLEHGETLPAHFEVCSKYEPDEKINDEDDWNKTSHYACQNCKETIRMAMSREELFQKYNENWRKLYPLKDYSDPKRTLSKGKEAKEGEELYYADAAFGHHSGIDLCKIEEEPDFSYRPRFLSETLLFLYRKVKVLDSSHLQSLLDAQNKLFDEEREKQELKEKEDRSRDEKEAIETVKTFFKFNG